MDKYGIIQKESIRVEGDERSRTNPGHGYPAHTVTTMAIREFPDKSSWETWIERASKPRTYGHAEKFTAIIYREVEVVTEVKINIGK